MSFLRSMRIRGKLFVGFGLLLLITIFISAFAAIELRSVDRDYAHALTYPFERYRILSELGVMFMDSRRMMNQAAMYINDRDDPITGINNQEAGIFVLRQTADQLIAEYRHNLRSDPQMTDQRRASMTSYINSFEASMHHYFDYYIAGVIAAARIFDEVEAIRLVREGVNTAQDAFVQLDAMTESSQGFMTETRGRLSDQANRNFWILIALCITSVIFGLIIAFVISGIVTKPINEVVRIVDNVANGDFNINYKRDLPRDEIGVMTGDVYHLVNIIKDIVGDISKFSHEASVNGDIYYRIEADRYKGGYKEMIDSLNSFADDFVDDVMSVLAGIDKVNEGDFNYRLKELPGKKASLNKSVEGLLQNLKSVSAEINSMIDAAAVKGDLHFQVDANKYSGGWNSIMIGLNKIAESVDAPIVEIRDVMNLLAEGNFTKKVEGNYAGDFKIIKDAVNWTIDELSAYIGEITNVLDIMSSGDLTFSINRDYVGSFGAIKDSLNTIATTLNKTMSEISSASEQVLSGSKQISASAMDLANGATTQASSVQELNASVDLINQQTQHNAESANEANDLSLISTDNAIEGNEAMKQTLAAMAKIKDASQSISKIIKNIQDIAFQTNLLALNAAVEAARAGEHGRGFAVVAEEVRSLAARSQTAAGETTELIGNSINAVETGSSIAESTAATLDTIVDNANKVLQIVSTISAASREQAEAIAQVSIGLSQISQVVQSNSAVSEETAAAAEELNSQAEILRQLVSFFRL